MCQVWAAWSQCPCCSLAISKGAYREHERIRTGAQSKGRRPRFLLYYNATKPLTHTHLSLPSPCAVTATLCIHPLSLLLLIRITRLVTQQQFAVYSWYKTLQRCFSETHQAVPHRITLVSHSCRIQFRILLIAFKSLHAMALFYISGLWTLCFCTPAPQIRESIAAAGSTVQA